MAPMVRCLSVHASYACQRSGVCCASDWPIPVEPDRLKALRGALASGSLRRADGRPDDPTRAGDGGSQVLATTGGRCVFLESPDGPDTSACAIHRELGPSALPLACRQFPRISVSDPRGVSVTLSHYCPTAARLLGSTRPLSITTAPVAFPPDGEYVGLDAAESLPPRLRPDMLMDWEAWWEWERLAVALLADPGAPVDVQLGRLGLAIEQVRHWQPGSASMADTFGQAATRMRERHADPFAPSEEERTARRGEIVGAMAPRRPPPTAIETGRRHRTTEREIRSLVTAHAFANWTAHLGQGLRTWLRSIEAPFVLLRSGLTVAEVDLWLRHLADPSRLADAWSRSESATSRP